jgi:hypothetical protein
MKYIARSSSSSVGTGGVDGMRCVLVLVVRTVPGSGCRSTATSELSAVELYVERYQYCEQLLNIV